MTVSGKPMAVMKHVCKAHVACMEATIKMEKQITSGGAYT